MCLLDDPLLVNHIRNTSRILSLRCPTGAIRQSDRAVPIGDQAEGKRELLRELTALVRGIEAAADDSDSSVLKVVVVVPKLGTFFFSARGVCPRKEPENHSYTEQLAQPHDLSILVSGLKVRRSISSGQGKGCWKERLCYIANLTEQ